MSFKEINSIRKSGKLNEAYQLAKEDLSSEPKNIWAKRAMAWVLYDFMKQHSNVENYDSFLTNLNEFIALELSSEEELVFSSVGFQVGSIVFALARQQESNESKIISLYKLVKLIAIPVKTDAYSFVFKAFHKALKNTAYYLGLIDWWGLDNFIEDDYKKGEVNGKQIMSLVEQTYIAYSKRLLLSKPLILAGMPVVSVGGIPNLDIDRIKKFLPYLNRIICQYPNYQYPLYFKAKLMIAIDCKEDLLTEFIPFAKSKKNDFWVWDLMSEMFDHNDDRKLACLCKALSLKAKDDFLIKVRTNIIPLLLAKQMYVEAKFELDTVLDIRNKNQWKIQSNLLNLQETEWYNNTFTNKNNKELYSTYNKIADQILYCDIPEEIVVIEHINADKKIANFVKDKSKRGFFKYSGLKTQPKIGEVYKVRLEGEASKEFYKVYTLVKFEDYSECKSLKLFNGNISVLQKSSIGFVDSVFIGPDLVKKYELVNNQEINGNAILSFNKKKNKWGWKAIQVFSNQTL